MFIGVFFVLVWSSIIFPLLISLSFHRLLWGGCSLFVKLIKLVMNNGFCAGKIRWGY